MLQHDYYLVTDEGDKLRVHTGLADGSHKALRTALRTLPAGTYHLIKIARRDLPVESVTPVTQVKVGLGTATTHRARKPKATEAPTSATEAGVVAEQGRRGFLGRGR